MRCPTCGVTRAIIALFGGDIRGYIHHNAMAIPMIAAVILLLHLKHIRMRKIWGSVTFFVLILNTVYYFYRIL